MSFLDSLVKYFQGAEKTEDPVKKAPVPIQKSTLTKDLPRQDTPDVSATISTRTDSTRRVPVAQAKQPKDRSKDIPSASQGLVPDDKKTRVSDLKNFMGSDEAQSFLDNIAGYGLPTQEDISDNIPGRKNLEIANRILADDTNPDKVTRLDSYVTKDRTDYSPLLGYIASVSDGKFNKLAESYTPPKSMDEFINNAMNTRENAQKNRDHSEYNQAKNAIAAYNSAIKPQVEGLKALQAIYLGGQRADGNLTKTIIDAIQSGKNADTQALKDYLGTITKKNTDVEIANASLRAKAARFKQAANASYGKKNQYLADELNNEIITFMAPIFSRRGGAISKDEKIRLPSDQRVIGEIATIIDAVVIDNGMADENSSPEEMHRARMKAARYIRSEYNPETKGFNDPQLQETLRKYKGAK
jgi:hypothetical protein